LTTEPSIYTKARSDLAGIEWPPISVGNAAIVSALLHQLEETQWFSREQLTELQFRQLGHVVRHAVRHSPHFRDRLRFAGLTVTDILSPDGLLRLPVLRRRALQAATNLFCSQVPPGHAPLSEVRTSGSTGTPVAVKRTVVGSYDAYAHQLRDHFWHRRDFSGRFCAIRADKDSVVRMPDWGPPVNLLFASGEGLGIPCATSIDEQVALIRDFAPDGLMVYPSNLAALMRAWSAPGAKPPNLSHLRTLGETVSSSLRDEARTNLGVEIEDCYSSREFGTIALQCPATAMYHVMESVIVEILDDQGRPCPEGQIGRVTVTDLHNFATPLIRYETGDYAEHGGRCSCGRGLPVLKKIYGRERNLVRLPDGSRHWPIFGMAHFRDIAPLVQFQFIQSEPEALEFRLVATRTLSGDEERALTALVQKELGYPFALRFAYFEGELPKRPNGKFEEFICNLA
jgi:phenylacetate-CoA ligase